MIKLKTEVNKSQVMREMKMAAIKSFENTWQKELKLRVYMGGCYDLFKKLRSTEIVCKCKSSTWNRDAGCDVCDDCGKRI